MADVIRAVEGPLASVRGAPPEEADYAGAASALPRVWIAVRVNLRRVVEQVTIADIAAGRDPGRGRRADGGPGGVDYALTEDPGAAVGRGVGYAPSEPPAPTPLDSGTPPRSESPIGTPSGGRT